MGTLALPAQDWQTVDDFALASGDAGAQGVATDAAGGIYVVGTANGHGIVRYSADGGTNWITRDDFVYPATNNSLNAVMVDSQGSVYVGGSANRHWIVRRSQDRGVTWETVDDYFRPFVPPETPGIAGVVYSLSSDGQGRVYGAGPLILTDCPCYNTWWVRGSSIGGTNWDDKLVMSSGYGSISQGTCAGQDVYVTGTTDSSSGDGNLRLVLRSSDHGATWSTVFQATNDLHNAITADLAGNLYFAGAFYTSNSIIWLVSRLAPGGTNWTALDGSSYAAEPSVAVGQPYGASIAVGSIAVDAAGNVAVLGTFTVLWTVSCGPNCTSYGANQAWVTGQYSAATGQWSTTDIFSYSTNMHDYATGIAFAPSGSVFTVGYGTSDSGQRRWVVRKQAANQLTVQAPPPKALFTATPGSGTAPLNVQFTDMSTGTITGRDWNFGDGSAHSSEQDPSHTYTNAGNYTVALLVTGPGGSDTNILMIAVTALTPQQRAESLISMVDDLVHKRALNRGEGRKLKASVRSAMLALDLGSTATACSNLAAFVNEVQAYLGRGRLTQAHAQALTDAANELMAAIGCQ